MSQFIRLVRHDHSLRLLRRVATLGVIALCVYLIWNRAHAIDAQMLAQSLLQTTPWQWFGALVATSVSYAAFGQFEACWHVIRNTGLSSARARQLGMAAAAIGQTFGFGAVTGAAVRLRVMGRDVLGQTLALSAAVSLSFLVCLALIAAPLALLADFAVSPYLWGIVAFSAVFLVLHLPALRGPLRMSIEPRQFAILLGLSLLDVFAMALAFYLLLPDTAEIAPGVVIAAFAIALGAGLLSNAPGGIGAFDLTLCVLLAPLGDSTVILTLLAFRIVSQVIPAGIAMVWIALNPHRAAIAVPTQAPADWGLCGQGARVVRTGGVFWLTRTALGFPIALGAGFGAIPADQITAARGRRRGDIRFTCIYKAPGRLALAARMKGWTVRRIAADAVIDLRDWSLDTPGRKRLRRNLRQADKAGVTITFGAGPADWPELARVASIWAAERGGELGFSMGQFDRTYLSDQEMAIIRHQGRIVGFVSLHRGLQDWSLDLIRQIPQIPEGAMHLAICAVIAQAQEAGARQLSLGAVPFAIEGDRLSQAISNHRTGLIRFKSSFKPRWVPLYLVAPNKLLLVVTAIAITWAVQRPLHRAISRWHLAVNRFSAAPHDHHEPFSIDQGGTSWQAVSDIPQGRSAL